MIRALCSTSSRATALTSGSAASANSPTPIAVTASIARLNFARMPRRIPLLTITSCLLSDFGCPTDLEFGVGALAASFAGVDDWPNRSADVLQGGTRGNGQSAGRVDPNPAYVCV